MWIRKDENPRMIDVVHQLSVFQELVGGMIEVVDAFPDSSVVLVCNESGRNEGEPVNRIINDHIDICGDFFLCGQTDDGWLADFPVEKELEYSTLFHLPG